MTPKSPDNPGIVVEMDAMDGVEWVQDQHTPSVHETRLAELVKQSQATPPPVRPSAPRSLPRAVTSATKPALPLPSVPRARSSTPTPTSC